MEELKKIIDPEQGIKISGQGIVIGELNKVVDRLDRIAKLLYFMEKRQEKILEIMEKQKV